MVDVGDMLGFVRDNWTGSIITNNNLKAQSAAEILASNVAQAVSFGRPFISNPDFVERTKHKVELARVDRDHLYTGEAVGYTDYPAAAI